MKSRLTIQKLTLDVFLGWPEQERQEKQTVSLNVEIVYPKSPEACETDDLDNTFCYAELIAKIKQCATAKSFRLIEHLGHEIFCVIKTSLPSDHAVQVQLTKWPTIADLIDGVCFTYGDF